MEVLEMKTLTIFSTVLILILTASAETLLVPSQYPEIQSGIDAAVDGDTVLIADGTYYGTGNKNLDFLGKAITVTSENGPETCIIDCEDFGRGFYFHSGETGTSLLSGIRIINGFTDYTWQVSGGAGVLCKENSSPVIENCIFEHCIGDETGGGIYCVYNSHPLIDNCIFTDNHSYYGGGIYACGTSPTITNCTFAGNSAGENGGGICCFSGSTSLIENCTFINNSAMMGGGVKCWNTTSASIVNCTFIENTATWNGGGIGCAYWCDPVIERCVFAGNSAPLGGGLSSTHESSASIINCTFYGNSASNRGGGIGCEDHSTPQGVNIILWENTAPSGPQIGYEAGNDFTAAYSDIQGGWPGAGNIDDDPLFFDPQHGIFQLTANSPCIDAGDPLMPLDPDSTIADMGAFYYDQTAGIEDVASNIHLETSRLYPVFPNPFNPSTTIRFELWRAGQISLKVYDIRGRVLGILMEGWKDKGDYSFSFNASDLTSGIYFVRLESGGSEQTQKLVLVK